MDLDAAVALLDEVSVTWTESERIAWRIVRGTARRGRRISSTTLPAIGAAAQHAIAAREHLTSAIDAMGGAVGGREGEVSADER